MMKELVRACNDLCYRRLRARKKSLCSSTSLESACGWELILLHCLFWSNVLGTSELGNVITCDEAAEIVDVNP